MKCTKEVGKPGKGWHECGRRAVYEIVRQGPSGMIWTHYACPRHKETLLAHDPIAARAGIRTVRHGAIA